ncbi:MAG: hypothetical protein AB7Q29_00385 [Vicinamibacterales bacterium]
MPVLSKLQHNQIYQLISKAGLDPSDGFERLSQTQAHRGLVEIYVHAPTQSRFDFSLVSDDKYWSDWWPAVSGAKSGGDKFRFWPECVRIVQLWAEEVRRNHEAPDLWAEAAKAHWLTDAAGEVQADNSPFNPAEIELLKPKLEEVRAYIEAQQELTGAQAGALQARFHYLLGAAKRGMGRIDWMNIVVSQIVQLFTNRILDSSLYQDVMRHASATLGTVLHLGSKFLPSL